MKTLSLSEFRDFCNERSLKTFVFDTRNQSDGLMRDTIIGFNKYNYMMVTLSPGSICFKNDFGGLCFDRVAEVRIDASYEGSGVLFRVACDEGITSKALVEYVIIADV